MTSIMVFSGELEKVVFLQLLDIQSNGCVVKKTRQNENRA